MSFRNHPCITSRHQWQDYRSSVAFSNRGDCHDSPPCTIFTKTLKEFSSWFRSTEHEYCSYSLISPSSSSSSTPLMYITLLHLTEMREIGNRFNIIHEKGYKSFSWRALQGFSQDFRIGCPKTQIWGELGVQVLIIPLHYTQKLWILGHPKDTQTPLWLSPGALFRSIFAWGFHCCVMTRLSCWHLIFERKHNAF